MLLDWSCYCQAVLEAALQESRAGEQIHLTFDETGEGRVAICLSHKSSHAPIERRNTLDRLAVLARKMEASATFADPIVVSLPMHDNPETRIRRRTLGRGGETIGLSVAGRPTISDVARGRSSSSAARPPSSRSTARVRR